MATEYSTKGASSGVMGEDDKSMKKNDAYKRIHIKDDENKDEDNKNEENEEKKEEVPDMGGSKRLNTEFGKKYCAYTIGGYFFAFCNGMTHIVFSCIHLHRTTPGI